MAAHNPDNLTPEQVEVDKGYRLLDEDEIQSKTRRLKDIERWRPYGLWSNAGSGNMGADKIQTYRTKLSREALALARLGYGSWGLF